MKQRQFYPRQVLKALHGEHADLSCVQWSVLRFLLRKSRDLGYAVIVEPITEKSEQSEQSKFISIRIESCVDLKSL